MRRIFLVLVAAFAVLALIVFVGPSLPEGNPVREFAEGVRALGGSMGRGFGGGYQPITP